MTTTLKEKTSKRIKELRMSKGYTMKKLAELVGVSKSTIAKWENGYVENMRQEKVTKMAELFNVNPAYILGYDENKDLEKRFIDRYDELDPDQQKLIDNMIEAFLSKK